MKKSREIIQRFNVEYEYKVFFSSGIFKKNSPVIHDILLADPEDLLQRKILFVIEDSLLKHYPSLCNDIRKYCTACGEQVKMTSDPQTISGGEKLKNFGQIESLCQLFAENNLCRHSFVGIIGGGAFLDSIGLAASLVHRGIRQIRIPTTVLSQCDSGVGVKTGVNMFGKKNFAGTFAPPYAVINDSDFLESLEYRDWISGVPEAFKVAMIKDAGFFRWLCQNSAKFAERDMPAMIELVERCAELHLNHIASSGDPFEFGSARPLDFGHWTAHKLEMMTNGRLRHGEAVGIGILLDSFYALKTGRLEKDVFTDLIDAYRIMKLPVFDQELLQKKADGTFLIMEGIEEFREHLGGELHITLPDGLGRKEEISSIDEHIILEGIEFLSILN